jgi:hypothetical protein
MSGCLKLFPKTEVAVAHEKLQKKIAEKKKLNGWDEKMLEAIHGFIAKTMSYDDTVSVIRRETASRNAWIARKYRGR